MRSNPHRIGLGLTLAFAMSAPAAGQDVRTEMARDLEAVAEKVVSLAQAMPSERYTWRPADGVRSVGEVFMHLAGGNYFILIRDGLPAPDDVPEAWHQSPASITDKDEIVAALRASFDHALATLDAEDLERPTVLFGRQTTFHDVMMLLQTHAHEHLGQSIAYARVNGVTPPWSAR